MTKIRVSWTEDELILVEYGPQHIVLSVDSALALIDELEKAIDDTDLESLEEDDDDEDDGEEIEDIDIEDEENDEDD